MKLRREEPESFAGTLMRPDGSLELRVTRFTPAVARAVETAKRSSCGAIAVNVVEGLRYSLAELEVKRDEILRRADDLAARGVRITGFGVDIRANRVRVEVKALDPQKAVVIADEFGADKVELFNGGEWTALTKP